MTELLVAKKQAESRRYSFSVEPLIAIKDEARDLLDMHWRELATNRHLAKLDPIWGDYFRMENANQLELYVARGYQGEMVGYAAFFVRPHIHYQKFIVAFNDVVFIHPDWRRGAFGFAFLRYCESMLHARGDVHKIAWHLKTTHDWGRILARMGYAPEEVLHTKLLGIK